MQTRPSVRRALFLWTGWLALWRLDVPPVAAQPSRYQITDIGIVSHGGSVSPARVNNNGQVVGTLYAGPSQTAHAFLWDAAAGLTDLGTLHGTDGFGGSINDGGVAVVNGVSSVIHGFLWQKGALASLDFAAFAINRFGQIAGAQAMEVSGSVVYHAVTYRHGLLQDVGAPGDQESFGLGVNDRGQVVGYAQTSPGNPFYHAYVWDAATGMTALDAFGCSYSAANAINASGEAVGYALFGVNRRAILWQNGQPLLLDDLMAESDAFDINDRNPIVGRNADGGFLWEEGRLYDLDDLIGADAGWNLESATAINDRGQIVSFGSQDADGPLHALLLTPAAAVPESGAFALTAASGIVSFIALRRTHRRAKRTALCEAKTVGVPAEPHA